MLCSVPCFVLYRVKHRQKQNHYISKPYNVKLNSIPPFVSLQSGTIPDTPRTYPNTAPGSPRPPTHSLPLVARSLSSSSIRPPRPTLPGLIPSVLVLFPSHSETKSGRKRRAPTTKKRGQGER